MELRKALRVQPGDSLSFVGAGGKTSMIRALTRELKGHHPVIITTTTHLGREQSDLAEVHLVARSLEALGELLEMAGEAGSVLMTGPLLDEQDRWSSVDPPLLEKVFEIVPLIDAVLLIEADGARQKLVKAPAAHEPAIPTQTKTVVPVLSARALGKVLTPEVAHRVEELARLLGVKPGAELTEESFARLLSSPDGALKRVPPAAEVRALVTSTDQLDDLSGLRAMAAGVLAVSRASAVCFGSSGASGPVLEVHARRAGIVLAAGGSERMGQSKQLLKAAGRSLVRRAVEAAMEGGLDQVVVTLGEDADRIRAELADQPVQFVPVAEWRSGQSYSLRAGMGALSEGTEAAIFFLADMPWVDGELVRALVRTHSESLASIVAPRYGDRNGNPVLFDRRTFDRLAEVEGDRGGKQLFPEFDVEHLDWDERAVIDIDRPEDLVRLTDDRWE